MQQQRRTLYNRLYTEQKSYTEGTFVLKAICHHGTQAA